MLIPELAVHEVEIDESPVLVLVRLTNQGSTVRLLN
jgi:hypothetical protein